ncbi:hypothetical protein STRPS_2010 [Streptococcus pseudoporcinus LQ 940-04]|uniref:Uncharacterized protein n=1 Tax=Streptococcus pseudoporcinus LQ 940-04 TaxID=875093 RepID=G5KAP7_9STRE|nr:hypothetical protein STRPS_2010 [Streptococcus pseudoporcinus LQ 940-04]
MAQSRLDLLDPDSLLSFEIRVSLAVNPSDLSPQWQFLIISLELTKKVRHVIMVMNELDN